MISRLEAIQPGLIEALKTLGETKIISELTEHFSVQSLLGGGSVVDVFKQMFAGSRFATALENSNGARPGSVLGPQPRG